MQDTNSPESVAERASQTDPIIMYLVVRESLVMSMGKTAAQVGHAVQMLTLKYMKAKLAKDNHQLFEEWLNTDYRKVILKADDKEWAKLKKLITSHDVIVIDAGLTEIEPGSETVIGLYPVRKTLVSKVVKRLQALK